MPMQGLFSLGMLLAGVIAVTLVGMLASAPMAALLLSALFVAVSFRTRFWS